MKHISFYMLDVVERHFSANQSIAIKNAMPKHVEFSPEKVNRATPPNDYQRVRLLIRRPAV